MNSKGKENVTSKSTLSTIRGDLGGAAVECSMLVLMLVSIVGGIIDFGLRLALTHQVQHAAREGARFAAELPNLNADDVRVEDYVTRLLPSQSPLFDAPAVMNGALEDSSGLQDTALNACDMEVSVTVRQKYAYSFLSMLGIGNADVTRKVRMRSHNQPLC